MIFKECSEMQDEEYKVSDLAKLLDLTPETIRYYESVGIVKPRHDEVNRYRYYLSTDFSRLYIAKMLRSMGFSLSEIKSFFYEKNDLEQKEASLRHMELLKSQVRDLENQIKVLDALSGELGDLGRLEKEFETTKSDPFWLVPFRLNYSYRVEGPSAGMIKEFLDRYHVPRYSYIMKAAMEEGLPSSARYTGYSVPGEEEKPAPNAIFVPGRKALRFAYRLIAGERFNVCARRIGLYERLRGAGIDGQSVEIYGHTINISTENDITYLNNVGYIPLDGGPLVDWAAITEP